LSIRELTGLIQLRNHTLVELRVRSDSKRDKGSMVARIPMRITIIKVVDRAKPGQPLRQAEQGQITSRGGPTNKSNPNGGTLNKRDAIAQPKHCDPPTGTRIPTC